MKEFTEEQKQTLERKFKSEEEYKKALGKWFPDYYEWCEYFNEDPDSENDYYMKPGIMMQVAHDEGYLSEEMLKKWDYLKIIHKYKMSYDDYIAKSKEGK